jgi:inhibitor of KinA sporulation pathway (predicted exonuclease)
LSGYPGHRSGATEIELNLKTLSAICKGLRIEIELEGALKLWGLPMEGTHHRGHDDAWNIAAILWECLKRLKGLA